METAMGPISAALLHWGGVLLQLLVATICGGAIGYQREIHDRPAGFRTHVLVCVGSAVYMLVSVAVGGSQYDPGRIAAQVASGIGFLGAGTIIKQGSIVRGLTTAASLWAAAGIGLAAGFGGEAMGIAVLGTIVVLTALGSLKSIENAIERQRHFSLTLTVSQPRQRVEWLQRILTNHGIELISVTLPEEEEGIGDVVVDARAPTRADLDNAVQELAGSKYVQHLRWTLQ